MGVTGAAHARPMTWRTWWSEALIRAVQVGALAAASAIGTEALLREIDWIVVAEIAGLAVVLSVLTSLTDRPLAPGAPFPPIPPSTARDEHAD